MLTLAAILVFFTDIWSPFISQINRHTEQLINISTSFDNYLLEKLHLKFGKSILGVHAKANNGAVRGELGRMPIIIFFLKSAIKYWVRLQTWWYWENVDLALDTKCCWLRSIQSIYKTRIKRETWKKWGGNKQTTTYILQYSHKYIWHLGNNLNLKRTCYYLKIISNEKN